MGVGVAPLEAEGALEEELGASEPVGGGEEDQVEANTT